MNLGTGFTPGMVSIGLPLAASLVGAALCVAFAVLRGVRGRQVAGYGILGLVSGVVLYKVAFLVLKIAGYGLVLSGDGRLQILGRDAVGRVVLPLCGAETTLAKVREAVDTDPAIRAAGLRVQSTVFPQTERETALEVRCSVQARMSDGRVLPLYYRSVTAEDRRGYLFTVRSSRFED